MLDAKLEVIFSVARPVDMAYFTLDGGGVVVVSGEGGVEVLDSETGERLWNCLSLGAGELLQCSFVAVCCRERPRDFEAGGYPVWVFEGCGYFSLRETPS